VIKIVPSDAIIVPIISPTAIPTASAANPRIPSTAATVVERSIYLGTRILVEEDPMLPPGPLLLKVLPSPGHG
jgi:hypothetical protein